MIRDFLVSAALFIMSCTALAADVDADNSRFGYTVKGSSLTIFVTDGGEGDYGKEPA